ncbi:hypothetical protein [Mediterraneibacter glycyrrhizinilyticus]|uniref:hypothetical protein n=1 Tax=Mediterraneibacter glycyrrhizinilyticus TaxID=342942 RepID=UPI0025A37B49|nr:hypothetical protein [Mediterraneibacter glycyrrhizinilyticus]MDM8125292.1 hypothetical protein [Mediterraneibacter glycyrrhizinilyticus]
MELNEEEKRQLFQVDGDCQAKVLDELYMTARFTRNPEQRDMVRGLMAKLRVLSNEQCMDLVKDIQKNYHLPYMESGQNPLMNQFVNCVDVNAQIICHFIGKQNLRQITAFIRIDIIRTHQLTTFLCAACV